MGLEYKLGLAELQGFLILSQFQQVIIILDGCTLQGNRKKKNFKTHTFIDLVEKNHQPIDHASNSALWVGNMIRQAHRAQKQGDRQRTEDKHQDIFIIIFPIKIELTIPTILLLIQTFLVWLSSPRFCKFKLIFVLSDNIKILNFVGFPQLNL